MKKKLLSLTTFILCALGISPIIAGNTSARISPTLAHRTLDGMTSLLQTCAEYNKVSPSELDTLLDTVIQEEIAHPDYYSFYHAQHKNWFFLTECITAIYEWHYKTTFPDFVFLRLPTKDFSLHSSCYDHMHKLGIANRWPWPAFDASGIVRKFILSVNCSLLGSINKPAECTLSYFLSAHSCLNLNPEKIYHILKRWFDEAGISVPYPVIVQAYELFEKEFTEIHSGIVYHLLIPRDSALKHTYIAVAGGRFQGEKQTSQKDMEEYTQSILEEITTKPTFENNLYQARIHCCEESIINPHSGTKIRAYVLPSQQTSFSHKRTLIKKHIFDMLNA